MRHLICTLIALALIPPSKADVVRIATFNIESGPDTETKLIGETMGTVGEADIWLLQEVATKSDVFHLLDQAGDGNWRFIFSKSGAYKSKSAFNDHLTILFDTATFDLLEEVELHAIRVHTDGTPWSNLRAAQLVRLRHRTSQQEFWVGNVHLKCCQDSQKVRAKQSTILMEWVSKSDAPVILGGDFNIPVNPDNDTGNPQSEPYRIITRTLNWHQPSNPVKTHCGQRSGAMIDHFFTSEPVERWSPTTQIVAPSSDYCKNNAYGYSDHRPVVLTFVLP